MRTLFRSMVGLGVVALLASPALAQGQGRGFGRGGATLAGLLANASVQKELKLDDQQTEKAKELAEKTREESREKFQGLQDLSQEERRTKMLDINKEINDSTLKAVGAFLKPEQVTRLKQISYQQRGLQAFSDPEIAKKLNLTDAQKTDIQAISQETMESTRGLISQDSTPEERAEGMKKIAEARKAGLTKAEAKLNDEQQKTWKELLGAPFAIVFEPRPNN
jgi:Spy/CpxP family protein refolding chaperone